MRADSKGRANIQGKLKEENGEAREYGLPLDESSLVLWEEFEVVYRV